jgi:energy-coupling factor transporter ATP-binding protein EcfA2
VRAGEIFGLAGLIGAGRTDLLRTVFGLDGADAGEVAVFGAPAAGATPRGRWSQGLGFLSENRKEEGLMLNLPIADNITLTKLEKFGRIRLDRPPPAAGGRGPVDGRTGASNAATATRPSASSPGATSRRWRSPAARASRADLPPR